MTTDSATGPSEAPRDSTGAFDIVEKYRSLLASDTEMTKPIAAIESLIALLENTKSSTVFETGMIVRQQAKHLVASVDIPLPLEAGTDLFIHFIFASLREGGHSSFDAIRQHLLHNGRLFADRAIAARNRVASSGWRVVTPGCCVLTHGASRTVTALLQRAATERGRGSFRVIYVHEAHRAKECDRVVASLREAGIPVAEIGPSGVAHVMAKRQPVDMVMVGAEVVTQNKGIISRMGTYQLAKLATDNKPKIPVYVAAETHKFTRKVIVDHRSLKQDILDFRSEGEGKSVESTDAVDYTERHFITELLTEEGRKHLGYVTETLFKIYGNLLPSNDDFLGL